MRENVRSRDGVDGLLGGGVDDGDALALGGHHPAAGNEHGVAEEAIGANVGATELNVLAVGVDEDDWRGSQKGGRERENARERRKSAHAAGR